mmetsp:Transcript_80621/g.202839  ORF Transcript_80621/g.202839 Transcript_80621/m.202839 type:complete len:522 (-) Transcript_80621:118-1683(-)
MALFAALLAAVACLLVGVVGSEPSSLRPLRGSAPSATSAGAPVADVAEGDSDGDEDGGGTNVGRDGGASARRLNTAIDACPEDWQDYFAPAALEWVCACEDVRHRLHTHYPDLTNDHYHKHEACPTTTDRPALTTEGATTTSLAGGTHTASSTSTTTTPYCESCAAITAGPTTKTTTSTLTSHTKTKTTTTTRTTSTTRTVTRTTSTGTSVTVTGTTAAPTTTVTLTTSTETQTITSITSTSTLGPITNTSTKTITSTSNTLTSSTRTTTQLQPCSICPLYHFLCPEGCTNCVAPGKCRTVFHTEDEMFDLSCDHREAITPPDPCVEFVSVQVSCPAGNLFPSRPVSFDTGAYPRLKCRICGLDHLPADANPTRGHWAGTVSWGPNQYERAISEIEIHSYKLYLVDTMYQKIGDALAVQEVKLWHSLSLTCCDTSFYHADLDIVLPANASYFMVVPVTVLGLEINVGPVSERIVDDDRIKASASSARRTWSLSCCALQGLLLPTLLLLFAAGWPPTCMATW